MKYTNNSTWQFYQGHWKGEIAITFRLNEKPAYRIASKNSSDLLTRFTEFYQKCRESVPQFWDMGHSSRYAFQEIERLLKVLDLSYVWRVDRIIEEFEVQFGILEKASKRTEAGMRSLQTFVYELPGNFLILLESLSAKLPELEIRVNKIENYELELTGRYVMNGEGTGEEPVLFF